MMDGGLLILLCSQLLQKTDSQIFWGSRYDYGFMVATITYVRNICAHHSRLWNKTFGITPMMPRRTTFPFVTLPTKGTQHVYFVLCMILYLLNIINPSNTFRNKINVLLEEYPNIDAMGFPENRKEQPLWKS